MPQSPVPLGEKLSFPGAAEKPTMELENALCCHIWLSWLWGPVLKWHVDSKPQRQKSCRVQIQSAYIGVLNRDKGLGEICSETWFSVDNKENVLERKGKRQEKVMSKKKIKGYFLGSIKRNFAGSNSWKTWSEEEASDLKWSGQERREAVGPQYCT